MLNGVGALLHLALQQGANASGVFLLADLHGSKVHDLFLEQRADDVRPLVRERADEGDVGGVGL